MCNTCCFRAFDGHLCTCYPCQWNDESFEYLQIQRFFAQLGSLENKIIAASKSLSWLSIIYWIGCYIMCWQSAHSVNAQIQKILLMKAIKVTFKHYNLWVCSQKNFRIFCSLSLYFSKIGSLYLILFKQSKQWGKNSLPEVSSRVAVVAVLVSTAKSNNEIIHFIITSGNSSDKLMHISI